MATARTVSSSVPIPQRQLRPNPPNARRTTEALRELGYDSYASVLDLIDNSIDAQAKHVVVAVAESRDDLKITIDDDGSGMDEEVLDEALRLGSDTERESGDLGKYGLGLVTASIGLARRVEVLTRTEPSTGVAARGYLYGGFDLDEIYERNDFVKWIESVDSETVQDFPFAHGTRIQLSKTDRISNRRASEFADRLRKRIGQVFRKFLKAGVQISVNGKSAEAIDPLLLSDPNTKLALEMPIEVEAGVEALLRVVDLPDHGPSGNKDLGIIPQNSGFYILRNNREIMEAQTFDFYKKHPDFSHFRAEIAFDGSLDGVFHTDVKKMSITPSQSFLDKLRQATQGLITESAREGRRRANVERGAIDHSLAESNITRRTPLIPKPKALVETRQPRSRSGSGSSQPGSGDKTRIPHVANLKTVTGLKVIFDEGDYGEGPFYFVKQEGRTVRVTYNREHPFWRELVEHAAEPKVVATLDYLVFGLANAELLVPEQARIVKENVNATLVGLLV
jgi:hypothetical protein